MSGSPTSHQLAREVLEEHGLIHFYLDQISESLKALTPELADVEPLRRLAAQIEGLEERLKEHHQLEERRGLFRAIVDALPESRVEVVRLIKEHERMIEILEMARLHAQCGEPEEGDALRIDLEGFLNMFRRHEQDEERLIARAMTREQRSAD
jgi:hypothetical protein